jgi:hypothetical protein
LQIILTLLFNLVPASSVVVFGWSAFTLLLLYWLENVIVGVINAVKIAIAGLSGGKENARATIGMIPFFIFHYGIFCVIHGLLIWELFGDASAATVPEDGLFSLPFLVMTRLKTDTFFFWNAIALAIFQILTFLIYWLANGSWKTADPCSQTFAPYGRVVVVHVTIILAGVPVALLGQPLIAVVILALIKTVMEVGVVRFSDAIAEVREKLADQAHEDMKKPIG